MKFSQLFLFIILFFSGSVLHAQNLEYSIFVDLGPDDGNNGNATTSPDINGNHWNNLTNSSTAGAAIPLISDSGTTLPYELEITSGMSNNGINHGGLLMPEASLLDVFAIGTATQDYFFTTNSGSLRISNLETDQGYRFTMFASRNNAETRVTQYLLSGLNTTAGSLQSSGTALGGNSYNGNTSSTYISDFVFPDEEGNITLEVSRSSGSFAYLNVLKIEAYSDVSTVMVSDIEVTGEDISTNGGTAQMQSNIIPANASIQDVAWEVDQISIAKILDNGLLIPYTNGTVTVTARSLEEGSEVTGSKQIQVTNQAVQNLFIDFGPDDGDNGNATSTPDPNGIHWNNLTDPLAGNVQQQLINSENNNTDIQILIEDDMTGLGIADGGLLNPDTVKLGILAVETVTQDYFRTSNSSTIVFSNLNTDNGYRFHAFGSGAYTGTRKTFYEFTGLNTASGEIQTSGTDLGGTGNNGNIEAVYTSDIVFPDSDGTITFEIGVALGQFGYINGLQITEYTGLELCPESDPYKISIMGSSVARGQGAPNAEGYAFQYGQHLTERFNNGQGENWEIANISVNGNNTVAVLNRWVRDLLPQCGSYVIYGLSLGNEGIHNNGQTAFDQYATNMTTLIDQAKEQGIMPVVMNNYTREDFNATDYNFIKQMNLLIHEWEVPSINLLGAIDNGSGNWVSAYQADFGHPNLAGHTEFFYAMVPSLFDALEADKPLPERINNTYFSTGSSVSEEPISFAPDNGVHPFTFSIDIKTASHGTVASFSTTNGTGTLEITATGQLEYTAPSGNSVTSTQIVNDNEWHTISLSHYHARGQTFLYTDAVQATSSIPERLEVDSFFVNGPAAPAMMDVRDWLLYRSGMNQEEISALNEGRMLKSSLELYAPMDGQAVYSAFPFVNLAQSTSRLSNDLSTSVQDVDSQSTSAAYHIFPNPVRSTMTIEALRNQTIEKVEIIDHSGRIIRTVNDSNKVDFFDLPKGVYVMIVHSREGVNNGFRVIRK